MMSRSDIWHSLCVFSKGDERMLTESQVGSHKRGRASLTVVKPKAYPKVTAHEARDEAENETGVRHRSAWQSAVTALCLLWLCLNAIPTSARLDLHACLHTTAALYLAFPLV